MVSTGEYAMRICRGFCKSCRAECSVVRNLRMLRFGGGAGASGDNRGKGVRSSFPLGEYSTLLVRVEKGSGRVIEVGTIDNDISHVAQYQYQGSVGE